MPVEYYLPDSDLDRASFMTIFAAGLTVHAVTLGIDAPTLLWVQNAAKWYNYAIIGSNAHKKQSNEWVAYKDALNNNKIGVKPGSVPEAPDLDVPAVEVDDPIIAKIVLLVNTIKNKETYKESIGRDLGIIGTEIVEPDYNTVKPLITVLSTANQVILKWKKERFSSVDIYIDKGRGAGFVFLDNDSRPPFEMLINLPQGAAPETWTFKAIYKVDDKQVGLFSDPVSIVVTSGL